MLLTKEQKNYIKNNYKRIPLAELAANLDMPEKEVISFLKRKLRPDKFEKLRARFAPKSPLDDFNFRTFFSENSYIFVFLTALVFISYANSLNNAFVSDDIGSVSANPDIGHFGYIWSYYSGIIQRLIYFVVFKIFGAVPFYFRLSNILLHLGSTLLVFSIFRLLYNKRLAFMTATLFAVHPMLIESVAWISGHPYLENSFFFLFSFFFYLLGRKRKSYYYFSVLFYIMSLLALERGFVLCSVFFLYELFFGDLRHFWKKLVPYFAVSFAIAALALNQVGSRVTALKETYYLQPGTDSLLIKIPTSVAVYFQLIFWPDKLTLYHTEMIFTPWQYRLTVLVFLIYAGAIIYFYRKNKMLSFWLLLFIIPLAPTLSPLRIAWAVAERYAYLSTLGILVFIAWIFYKLSEREKLKIPIYILFSVVIIALSVRTILRNTDWKSEESLWFATAKTSPSGPNIHNNLGYIYFQKNEYDKAVSEFQLAIAINPAYGDAYHNLGNTYYQMQKLPEAAESYQKALELNPRLWQSHQNLAAIYFGQGWYDLSRQEIQKALEINPDNPDLKKNLDLVTSGMQNSLPNQPVTAPAP